ncbi:DMT family transporter [Maricaulis maris]|uniref:DMT family transporter n=1 Tax=Maricaulis maris TaxID=74318 RepID=UPI0014741FAD|nr:DMT family transporter [Maricaulis maris]
MIIIIGLLVGANFAFGKYIVQQGQAPLTLFVLQVFGASVLLTAGLVLSQHMRLAALVSRPVLIYCVVNGLIGVSAPQILGFFALQKVPASLFTMFVTLSPLMTFLVSSLVRRQVLPMYRLIGILIGLAGVSIATANGTVRMDFGALWLTAACAVPILLSIANVYRDVAMPEGVSPLVLAAGTLSSQALLFLPFAVYVEGAALASWTIDAAAALLGLCCVTALSYILTFELFRRTDGVGFSQVGYFATVAGTGAGAIFFSEVITVWFLIAVFLLFLGMAITNNQISAILSHWNRKRR